jgi:TolB protein
LKSDGYSIQDFTKKEFLMKKKHGLLLAFLTNLLFSMPCFAALNLELTRGVNSAFPIAIVPFAADTDIAGIVKNDLRNSGRFRVFAENKMPSTPHTASEINSESWRQASVDAVVVGEVRSTDSSHVSVKFALVDVVKNQKSTLVKETFDNIEKKDLRHLAHHISDLIYEALIGEKGAFSSRIAYVLTQHSEGSPTRYILEVADADGYNPRSILASPQPIMSPAWSHDGKKIAYVSFENNEAQIYIAQVASGERHSVSNFSGINGAPAWSPNDQQLALVLSKSGSPKIYVLDLASKSLRQLTQGSSIDTEPNFSPKSHSILFTSDRGGGPQLYKVDLSSHRVERVTYDGKYNARGSFSPDGKHIAMIHADGGGYNIAIQDTATGTLESLTKSGNDASPTFSPNGSMVLYETRAGGKRVLGLISTDGRVKLVLPAREGDVQDPAWGKG